MNKLSKHRFHHKTIFCAFFLFALLLYHAPAHSVEAVGEGVTYRQALNNALKLAVEQTMGTQVENQSLVENFMVVQEKILNHTKGYVKSFKVLEDSRDENGLYRLKIEADVDEAQLADSQSALATLMKMSAHPKVFVVGIDDDFEALSSLNPQFNLLNKAVIRVVRDEFQMNVIDVESFRLRQKNTYRYTDRKNNMKRARQSNAQFALFVTVLKENNRARPPLSLRLEAVDVASGLSLSQHSIHFDMEDWTKDLQGNEEQIIEQARSLVHAPAAHVASSMIETLEKENYGQGRRYELHFSRFDAKTIQYLEDDLTRLSGYVRHQLLFLEKNALAVSYWSELQPGALNVQVSELLKGQEIPFSHSVQNRNLTYRYKDPFFE